MFLFTVLLLTMIILMVVTVVLISAGGAVFTIIFADLFVCIFIIYMIMKALRRKKK